MAWRAHSYTGKFLITAIRGSIVALACFIWKILYPELIIMRVLFGPMNPNHISGKVGLETYYSIEIGSQEPCEVSVHAQNC